MSTAELGPAILTEVTFLAESGLVVRLRLSVRAQTTTCRVVTAAGLMRWEGGGRRRERERGLGSRRKEENSLHALVAEIWRRHA